MDLSVFFWYNVVNNMQFYAERILFYGKEEKTLW